jgi:hypothetical protein
MTLARTAAALLLGTVLAAGPGVQAQDKGGGLGGDPGKSPNDPKALLHVRVNQAIDSGVAWLKTKTFPPGNWETEVTSDTLYDPKAKGDVYVHPTGCTALSLYALLKCGVPKDDPVIKKGFQWLKATSGGITKGKAIKGSYRIPNGTYELATLILAIEARANPHKLETERERQLKFRLKKGEKLKTGVKLEPEDQAWMKELLDALLKRRNQGKGWRYGFWNGQAWHNGPRGDSDLSASNLTMLAVVAAERCGFTQPDEFYVSVLKWTLSMQEKEGPPMERWDPTLKEEDRKYGQGKDSARGFGYLGASGADGENKATGSMTACGLANIVICTSILEARESKSFSGELQQAAEKGWWDGVAWLAFHWSVDANTGSPVGYHYYYLYCLERACDMKRIHLLAGKPWYNLGAQVLVDGQLMASTGAWTKQDTHRPSDILNTCFALLFLNRATPAITGD